MTVTVIPPLDRTSPTFKADVDLLFGTQIPLLSAELSVLQADVYGNQAIASDAAADAEAAAALAVPAAAAAIAAKDISVALKPVTSASPPVSPIAESQWIDSNTGKHYIWYVDTDGGQWVELGGLVVDNATAVTILEAEITEKNLEIMSVMDGMSAAQKADARTGAKTIDQTSLIQAVFTAGSRVIVPAGEYLVNGQLTLKSNLHVIFHPGAKFVSNSGTTTNMLRGNALTNLRFENMVLEGNGLSGVSLAYLTSCSDVKFESCKITKSGSMGIQLDTCSAITVNNCNLSNNYYYGISDKNGSNNKFTNNLLSQNGITGVATSAGGRGINLWRCTGGLVHGNRFVSNNEYGFRIYSEAADVTVGSYGNIITDNTFFDNTHCVFVLYDELLLGTLVYDNVIANNTVFRTTNPTIGAAFVIHGGKNTLTSCHVKKTGTFGTFAAFNLYYAVNTRLIGCSAENTLDAVSLPNSTYCTIDGFLGKTVGKAISSLSGAAGGNRVMNSTFYHGGGGGTDVAVLSSGVATGKNWFTGNRFHDFYTGIHIGNEAVALFGNTTIGSTNSGIKKTGNDLSLQEFGGNSWDNAAPYHLSTMEKNASTHRRAIFHYPAIPTSLTWTAGDMCIIQSPAVGEGSIARCTVGGTPGTWVAAQQNGPLASIAGTPEAKGFISIVAGDAYVAVGTSSSADWKKTTP